MGVGIQLKKAVCEVFEKYVEFIMCELYWIDEKQ